MDADRRTKRENAASHNDVPSKPSCPREDSYGYALQSFLLTGPWQLLVDQQRLASTDCSRTTNRFFGRAFSRVQEAISMVFKRLVGYVTLYKVQIVPTDVGAQRTSRAVYYLCNRSHQYFHTRVSGVLDTNLARDSALCAVYKSSSEDVVLSVKYRAPLVTQLTGSLSISIFKWLVRWMVGNRSTACMWGDEFIQLLS